MNVLFVYRNKTKGFSIQRCFRPIEAYLANTHNEISITSISLPCKRAYPHHLFIDVIYVIINLLSNKYDIIQITGGCPHVIFVKPLCKLLGIKIVTTIHDLGFYKPDDRSLKNKWHYFIGVRSLKYADHIVFISDSTKKEAYNLIDIKKIPFSIIGDPIDPAFSYVPHIFRKEYPVVLHVGTHHRKNLEGTAIALKGVPYKLRIVGNLSEQQISCLLDCKTDYSQVSNLSHEDIIKEYVNCDIVSFPTFYEGFGMPIIEAQATGRPVLTSNIPPMNEVVGKGTYIVNPCNINDIRKGYDYIFDNYDDIVKEGYLNSKRFSIEVISKQYYEIYMKYC